MYGEIPILATMCKAQQELIEDAQCGLLYHTQEEFNTQLLQLLESESLRKTLGANGKRKLLELYHSKADKAFLKLYDSKSAISKDERTSS